MTALLSLFTLCAAAALLPVLPLAATADDLIVTNESPAFVLDTRLPGAMLSGEFLASAETPAFTLDTRIAGVAPLEDFRIVAQSGVFTLDTRLPGAMPPGEFLASAETPAFTLDTRLPTDSLNSGNFVVAAESPRFSLDTRLPGEDPRWPQWIVEAECGAFVLDTRLPTENPLYAALVVQALSGCLAVDTRLPAEDPRYAALEVTAEYGPFTIDAQGGWMQAPAQALAGGGTAGKARFSPDGLRLAKSDGSRVLLWNLQSFRTNAVFAGHAGEVVTVEFSPLGDQLLTGSADGTFRRWDAASRNELGRVSPAGGGTVYAAYASDGARILAGRGGTVALYRGSAMEWIRDLPGVEGSVTAVALAPEGLALAGTSARTVLVWDTASGALLRRLAGHTHLITAAAFFPGGTNAMTASLDGTVRVWDLATGTKKLVIPQGTPVVDAFLSLDGSTLVSCSEGNPMWRGNGPVGTAYVWDAESGALERVLADPTAPSPMKAVALSPDHAALATAYADGSVRLWNTGLDPRPIYPVTPLPIGASAPLTLRSHGLHYFELDAEAGRSLVVTLEAGSGTRVHLTSARSAAGSADIPVRSGPGLSPDAEFANLGPVTPGGARLQDIANPPPGADIAAFRMTAAQGRLPSVYDYETFAQASVANLHCEMPMATSTSDKVYVLVFAPYLSAGTIQARLRAEFADFHLSSITPARGGNGGTVTSELLGTGLTPDTAVRLFNAGGASVAGQLSLWGDSTKAWFSFDLTAAPAGNYSVEVSRAGYVPAVLTNAFTVVAGGTPLLQARLFRPGRRPARPPPNRARLLRPRHRPLRPLPSPRPGGQPAGRRMKPPTTGLVLALLEGQYRPVSDAVRLSLA